VCPVLHFNTKIDLRHIGRCIVLPVMSILSDRILDINTVFVYSLLFSNTTNASVRHLLVKDAESLTIITVQLELGWQECFPCFRIIKLPLAIARAA